ncbi:hypothetical protein [Williamsia maris]|uniref:5,10-methylene-tetrahydrofolate dehydrogenase n=1 Tax=Williamsia maris TaxID=72806 RepID=A0ABT1HBM8_9NOCA|nr:hypothetical protein [Williamsia maris]MCP2175594.1 hypothetical protein [Williamsia maris]
MAALTDPTDAAGNAASTVLIVSDPGIVSRRVAAVLPALEPELTKQLGRPVSVIQSVHLVRLRSDDTIDYVRARTAAPGPDPHAIVVVTEIPRYTPRRPLISEVFVDARLAVISSPTLGAWATKRRLRIALTQSARLLCEPVAADERRRIPFRGSRWTIAESGPSQLYAQTVFSWLRTVLGMISTNEPLKTVPRLSSALAAAAAAGAFGIFYNSIWQMASYLPSWRLLLFTFLAIIILMGWLVLSNGLWDRTAQTRYAQVTFLYNMSTLATLFVCVLTLYATLFVAILLGGAALIDPQFMELILGRPVGVSDYINLAWLSSTMGVVAGGVGSSFDSETDLRRLTHGRRERERFDLDG